MTILNHIDFKQLPPPVRGNNDILHGVSRSLMFIVGLVQRFSLVNPPCCNRLRPFVAGVICVITLAAALVGCQSDAAIPEDYVHTRMGEFYAESRGLTETSADSVVSYYHKFASFHGQYPECEADQLFQPTVENLDSAFTKYAIVQIGDIIVKTQWNGETHINF